MNSCSCLGLGPSNIGSQHWGCCHETQKDNLVCKISDFHQAVDEI
jgi:hypothetical protein